MQPRLFSTYGQICATNFDWSWCPRASGDLATDLQIQLGNLGPFGDRRAFEYELYGQRPAPGSAQPYVVRIERASDRHLRVTYADGAQFVIDGTASRIFGASTDALTLEDLIVYLQGPILGLTLRLRGVTCLHASAATDDGRAFAVIGSAGMGKSTTAAALAQMGVEVLTDDVLALSDRGETFDVQPGLPRVLLWPESVRALFGDSEALPRLVGTWDKRYLDLNRPGFRFGQRPAPLAAIYVLGERLPAGSDPMLSELSGTSALMWMLANTYANDLLDARLRARELEVLGRLVSRVPIRLLRAPNDRGALSQVCRTILADFRSGS
jgi:hypothetical protein